MQTLATSKRAAALGCLIEGNSILSTSRITGVAKNTIVKLPADVGDACSSYQHEKLVNLPFPPSLPSHSTCLQNISPLLKSTAKTAETARTGFWQFIPPEAEHFAPVG